MNDCLTEHSVYPGLGRYLTPDDIGKSVVRVFPMDGDFSLIPDNKNDIKGRVLTVLDKDKAEFGTLILPSAWLDNNWLSPSEYIGKTKNVAAKTMVSRSFY